METIELFSARVCPFAHRSRLALMEKNLPFELIEIDLNDKPAWYAEVHPGGAVPALRQGDFLLRESLIINEYVNELANEPALLPASVRQRAEARLWIDVASSHLIPPFYRLLKARKEEEINAARNTLLEGLTFLDAELGRRSALGPYWFGRDISLTDIAIYPWFERWGVLVHYRGLAIPAELKSLHGWIATMQRRQSVLDGGQSDAFYIKGYAKYASNGT